ncbi:MAG: glycosyltransferase [Phycisphaerales bacterium]|nr:glycosyltransferase [Phycisphaerales bacterium]
MSELKVHIISFDVPYPADYGGVIDVFYTIKNLYEQGVSIYLHCFQYGRASSIELEKYCTQVWYYPRKTGILGISLKLPYMLYSRRDKSLLPKLISVEAPIIFEGIHSCYLLHHPQLSNRKKIIRNHNVEQNYFSLLAQRSQNLATKTYYWLESLMLKKFERKLNAAHSLITISLADQDFFQTLYPRKHVVCLPGFHPYNKVVTHQGRGTFCLYHGNLSHPENIEAALYLIEEVFADIHIPFVIAGKNPHPKIRAACASKPHISLIENPNDEMMNRMIGEAHIITLPTFQESGIKLKLLYALFAGRFVLTNPSMLYGTGLEELCTIAQNTEEFKQKILLLMTAEFNEVEIEKRKNKLLQFYSNLNNVLKIMNILRG